MRASFAEACSCSASDTASWDMRGFFCLLPHKQEQDQPQDDVRALLASVEQDDQPKEQKLVKADSVTEWEARAAKARQKGLGEARGLFLLRLFIFLVQVLAWRFYRLRRRFWAFCASIVFWRRFGCPIRRGYGVLIAFLRRGRGLCYVDLPWRYLLPCAASRKSVAAVVFGMRRGSSGRLWYLEYSAVTPLFQLSEDRAEPCQPQNLIYGVSPAWREEGLQRQQQLIPTARRRGVLGLLGRLQ